MTNRHLTLFLSLTTLALMAGFAALFIDKVLPTFQTIIRSLGG